MLLEPSDLTCPQAFGEAELGAPQSHQIWRHSFLSFSTEGFFATGVLKLLLSPSPLRVKDKKKTHSLQQLTAQVRRYAFENLTNLLNISVQIAISQRFYDRGNSPTDHLTYGLKFQRRLRRPEPSRSFSTFAWQNADTQKIADQFPSVEDAFFEICRINAKATDYYRKLRIGDSFVPHESCWCRSLSLGTVSVSSWNKASVHLFF